MGHGEEDPRGGCPSSGQSSVEYLGMVGVAVVVVGAILGTALGGDVYASAKEQVCRVVQGAGGTDCGSDNVVSESGDGSQGSGGGNGTGDGGTGDSGGDQPTTVTRGDGGSPGGGQGQPPVLPAQNKGNALPNLCYDPTEQTRRTPTGTAPVSSEPRYENTATLMMAGLSYLLDAIVELVQNEKHKEKAVKKALDDLSYCLPDYNIVIAQPHEGNLQQMDGSAMIRTIDLNGTTYRVYAFKSGKFTWAGDADLGWKNRGFKGVYDMSDDKRTVTFREPPHPKRKKDWKPGDEGCQIEGEEPPDRDRFYESWSLMHEDDAKKAVRRLVNDMRRCYPDYNVVAMTTEQASHWVDKPDSFIDRSRYRLNSTEFHEDEEGDDIASGRGVFDVYVFDQGTFKNDGDGGDINWAYYGDFDRSDDGEVEFRQPEKADLDADPTPTGSASVDFDDETPKYTEGKYPGTDFKGKVPKDKAKLTHSLVDEYSRSFPDRNIVTVKNFNEMQFAGVSGVEHLATVNGVDVFSIDQGTITNTGDGGWKNWGFTGDFEQSEDKKTVTFGGGA